MSSAPPSSEPLTARPTAPERMLAAAAFPRGELAALRELIDLYAQVLNARAAASGHSLALSGADLLADPALAAWASQRFPAVGQQHDGQPPGQLPRPPSIESARTWTPESWPLCLAPIPEALSRSLHPPGEPSARTLHSPAVLRADLTAAIDLLRAVWPEGAAEVTLLVRTLVGSVAPAGRQTSGSSASCPLAIAIEFEAGAWPASLADALVHESSHIKLRMVGGLDAVVYDRGEARYHHPWRRDPRPFEAVLVACHAFVAVHRFYVSCARIQGDRRALAQSRQLGAEVRGALVELRSGWALLTPTGQHIAEVILREHERTCEDAAGLGLDT